MNDWSQIDHIDIDQLAFCHPNMGVIGAIPPEYTDKWAIANVDVVEAYKAAGDDPVQRNRMLKWFLGLHLILLRKNGAKSRGRDRPGWDTLARRFNAWTEGDYTTVIDLFERALREAPRGNRRRNRAEDNGTKIRAATELMRLGLLSRSMRLLLSKGVGDLSDPRIVEQLARKHVDPAKAPPRGRSRFARGGRPVG